MLATLETDGSVHQTPVWYIYRDDQLFVGTASFSRKYRNVVARPMASLVIDVRTPGTERWVSGSGPVTVLRGDESRPIVASIHSVTSRPRRSAIRRSVRSSPPRMM